MTEIVIPGYDVKIVIPDFTVVIPDLFGNPE